MRRRPRFAIAAGLVLTAGLAGSASPIPPPGFLTATRWTLDDPLFGGFSAIELAGDGLTFTAITDRGGFTHARLTRNAETLITSIDADPVHLLKGKGSKPLGLGRTDSEGLAIAPDGTAYVSFEGVTRVLRYRRLDGPAENLPIPAAFRRMTINASLEALAIDADGTLYTLPERPSANNRPFPVYRFQAGVWDDSLSIRRAGSYLPVAADIGPDGRFYLLERQFRGLSGFGSRLRRFDLSPGGLTDERTLLESPVGLHDNLEGLSIWRDARNRLRATMISDDNFFFLQSTEIVEYLLPD